jgi:hypothetical protein
MRAVKAVLLVFGAMAFAHAAQLFFDDPKALSCIRKTVIWFVSGIVVHDFLFVPICLFIAFIGRMLLPKTWWAPLTVAAFCSVVLVLLAIPVWGPQVLDPANHTLLDRDYHANLAIALTVVWGLTSAVLIGRALARASRQRVQTKPSSHSSN